MYRSTKVFVDPEAWLVGVIRCNIPCYVVRAPGVGPSLPRCYRLCMNIPRPGKGKLQTALGFEIENVMSYHA